MVEIINELVAKFGFVVIKFDSGKAYLQKEHWRYLDPLEAPSILIGKMDPPKGTHFYREVGAIKLLYYSTKIKKL